MINSKHTPAASQKEIDGNLYSRFSHELRNPLSIILNELQNLMLRHSEVSEYEELDTIQSNLQYMQDLLNDFSALQNADTLSCHPTDIAEYLRDLIRAVKPSMDYLHIKLILNTDQELPELSIDRIRIRQAFLNLLRNAQDALPSEGGIIQITVKRFGEHQICITIADNGCGISPENLPRIFMPFFTQKKEGSGLGLAITKEIIEAHHGKITVESTPAKGTTFQIIL